MLSKYWIYTALIDLITTLYLPETWKCFLIERLQILRASYLLTSSPKKFKESSFSYVHATVPVLATAINNKDLRTVKFFTEQHARFRRELLGQSWMGKNSLERAIYNEDLQCAEYLLGTGCVSPHTGLIYCQNVETVQWLVKRGANCDDRDIFNRLVIERACCVGVKEEVALEILKRSNELPNRQCIKLAKGNGFVSLSASIEAYVKQQEKQILKMVSCVLEKHDCHLAEINRIICEMADIS